MKSQFHDGQDTEIIHSPLCGHGYTMIWCKSCHAFVANHEHVAPSTAWIDALSPEGKALLERRWSA